MHKQFKDLIVIDIIFEFSIFPWPHQEKLLYEDSIR